ncbi:hypothetical protein BC831DRAFT_462965 [Entophlyctis helioformis]|nr:hypothetical protein BC831DRAFT_462965 [Entophlyctis helioformis]
MSSNHELALRLTRFGNFGTIKLTFVCINALVLACLVPLFVYHREQPMIKYRSWTLGIVGVVVMLVKNTLNMARSFDHFMTYEQVRITIVIEYLAVACVIPMYISLYLRNYFLLQLPVVQAQLLDQSSMVDPEKYKAISKRLTRMRVLSSEFGAWLFYVPHAIVLMIIIVMLSLKTDFDAILLEKPNLLDLARSILYVSEFTISTIWLLYYLPRAPRDNFFIRHQLYIYQWSANIVILEQFSAQLVKTKPGVAVFDEIFISASAVFNTCVSIGLPLCFIYCGGFRYRLKISVGSITRLSTVKSSGSQQSSLNGADGLTPLRSNEQSVPQRGMTTSASGSELSGQAGGVVGVPGLHRSPTANSGFARKTPMAMALDVVLRDEKLKAAFAKYLAREFAMESLLFIEAVHHYKIAQASGAHGQQEIVDMCNKIVEEFIDPNAMNEINLPKIVRDKTLREIEAVSDGTAEDHRARHVFDDATGHIEAMLAINHIRKFQASPLYKAAAGTDES